MPKRMLLILSVLLVCLMAVPTVQAKGPVDKIVIAGPGLADPIEITDAESLSPFSPWTREFIAWDRGLVEQPPSSIEEAYTVFFYLKRHSGEFSLIYALHYAPQPSGASGYIYIPGRGDRWYRLNIGTIITGSSDRWDPNGKWHYATAEWDALMLGALGHQAAPRSADGSSQASGALPKDRPTSDTRPFGSQIVGQGRWPIALVLGTTAMAGIALWRLWPRTPARP